MNVCYDSCPKEAGQLVPRTPAARTPPPIKKKERKKCPITSDQPKWGGWGAEISAGVQIELSCAYLRECERGLPDHEKTRHG